VVGIAPFVRTIFSRVRFTVRRLESVGENRVTTIWMLEIVQ
jgi:hypothetical protein